MSDDYLCLTVQSRPGEMENDFKTRLSQFWTGMLRNFPDEFEKVYAETVEFESDNTKLSRQYLLEATIADLLEEELRKAGVEYAPIDREEIYSKYEATPPEWMWIEH